MANIWSSSRRGGKASAYELGDLLPSGVNFCFAAPSLKTIGALGDVVRGVADAECVRSACTGVRVDGASEGYAAGLEPGSDGGGASGAATEADMIRLVGYSTTAAVSLR